MPSYCLILCSLLGIVAASGSYFTVAEVKPHFGCTDPIGRERVKRYVSELARKGTGLISLLEMEFALEQPEGYTVFGGNCKAKHSDPAVMLVDESQFVIVGPLGDTLAGDYAQMPFLSNGQEPKSGPMCVADPTAVNPRTNLSVGGRPYAGAILRHKATNMEICVVTGTFPHNGFRWQRKFVEDVKGCGERQLVIIADTNANYIPGNTSDSRWFTMERIAANHSVNWGECLDPGATQPVPTCCNDTRTLGNPDPTWWYDRVASCRGGSVDQFEVEPHYFCGANEEHRFITARVWLKESEVRPTMVTIV